jgi:phosphoribosylanthranilate isomerase
VNADACFVREVLAKVDLHLLQFHGSETREYCEQFQRPYMKAIAMRPEVDVDMAIAAYPSAAGVLLDAYCPGVPGGTGATFDWQRVPADTARPIILAGGLTPGNVARAIQATRVYGVDVSSGVESSPGQKDAEQIRQFIHQASQA